MNTVVLTRLSDVQPSQRTQLPSLQRGPSVQHFVVAQGGRCAQGLWAKGEVLICRGSAVDGDRVVLVPRGRGIPRVGRIQGHRILGDAGEPCHPGRWQVAGRLVGTWQQLGEGWVCALSDAEGAAAPSRQASACQAPTNAPGAAQLGLFAA